MKLASQRKIVPKFQFLQLLAVGLIDFALFSPFGSVMQFVCLRIVVAPCSSTQIARFVDSQPASCVTVSEPLTPDEEKSLGRKLGSKAAGGQCGRLFLRSITVWKLHNPSPWAQWHQWNRLSGTNSR